MEPEPRKMQAERPLLLQDLSQSKLLLKFKQENKVEPTGGEESATDATINPQGEPSSTSVSAAQPTTAVGPASSSKSTPPPPEIKTSDSPLPSKTASISSRKSSFQTKMVLMTKTM